MERTRHFKSVTQLFILRIIRDVTEENTALFIVHSGHEWVLILHASSHGIQNLLLITKMLIALIHIMHTLRLLIPSHHIGPHLGILLVRPVLILHVLVVIVVGVP